MEELLNVCPEIVFRRKVSPDRRTGFKELGRMELVRCQRRCICSLPSVLALAVTVLS